MKYLIMGLIVLAFVLWFLVFTGLKEWSNQNPGLGQWVIALVTLAAVAGAFYIGNIQNQINEKLVNIEDSVDIFGYLVYVNSQPTFLRLTNIGKVQIYLTKFLINDTETKLSSEFLIPAGQQQNAWYDLSIDYSVLQPIGEVRVSLYFNDQLDRNWSADFILEHSQNGWATYVQRTRLIDSK